MAKEKAVYAPGELGKVRQRLGNIDDVEAKRVAQLLGGEVGAERGEESSPAYKALVRKTSSPLSRRSKKGGDSAKVSPSRRVAVAADKNEKDAVSKQKTSGAKIDPMDDPSVPIKLSYREIIKMNRYASQVEFDIKNFNQVVQSLFSFFSPPPDYLNSKFVTERMNEYYKHIENLVVSTRTLFPRNNAFRNERVNKLSFFAYMVLDTIRQWGIGRISAELTPLQSRPRNVKAADFSNILKLIYRPIFILEKLDVDYHIMESYKLLYRIILLENPHEANEKNFAGLIHDSLTSLRIIRKEIRFLLYPLLMKLVSDKWFPYEAFFTVRKNRYLAFIGASDADQIQPEVIKTPTNEEIQAEEAAEDDSKAKTKNTQLVVAEAEQKAAEKGLQTLEVLFPKAGWDHLSQYPDLYPYFRDVFSLKKTYALIAPTDPLLQLLVLVYILEELFFGLRHVSFSIVTGPDGNVERVNEVLDPIINNWHYTIEKSFEKEYLSRLAEYCRILEGTSESRTSNYAQRLLNELRWVKRLYFFPYYKFESIFPPPFKKQDVSPLYSEVRKLRRSLTAVAAGIERGNKMGGAEKKIRCDGIENPWDHYEFQIPSPISKRLDMLLGEKKHNNASLIFFTLAVTVVADILINNDSSWAYSNDRSDTLFRSVNGEGHTPSPGVDDKVDADALFRQSLNKRE